MTLPLIKREINKPDMVAVLEAEGINLNRNNMAQCPLHDDRTPSFKVFPDSQTFRCFGCGKHGDVISFIQEYRGLNFKDTLAYLGIKGEPTPDVYNRREAVKRKKNLRGFLFKWRRRYQNALIDRLRQLERIESEIRNNPMIDGAEPWDRVRFTAEIPHLEWKIELMQSGDMETIINIYEDFVR